MRRDGLPGPSYRDEEPQKPSQQHRVAAMENRDLLHEPWVLSPAG